TPPPDNAALCRKLHRMNVATALLEHNTAPPKLPVPPFRDEVELPVKRQSSASNRDPMQVIAPPPNAAQSSKIHLDKVNFAPCSIRMAPPLELWAAKFLQSKNGMLSLCVPFASLNPTSTIVTPAWSS